MKKYLHTTFAVLALGVSSIASASTVTIGDLNYDTITDRITNTSLNKEYVGLGTLAPLTYAQTVEAVTNGDFQDFRIANQAEAFEFFNALSTSAVEDTAGATTVFHTIDGVWIDGLFGANYTSNRDAVWFLSDEGTDAGTITLNSQPNNILIKDRNNDFAFTDLFAASGGQESIPVSWLLVRETSTVSAVPVPAAAFMFAPALLGFLGLRRRAKRA